MTIAPLVVLGTLVFTFINWLKFIRGRQYNSAITQVIVWASGVAAVWLVAASQFGIDVHVNSLTLRAMDSATKVVTGLLAASLLSTVNEVKKAIDNTDTAQTPKLAPGADGAPPPPPA